MTLAAIVCKVKRRLSQNYRRRGCWMEWLEVAGELHRQCSPPSKWMWLSKSADFTRLEYFKHEAMIYSTVLRCLNPVTLSEACMVCRGARSDWSGTQVATANMCLCRKHCGVQSRRSDQRCGWQSIQWFSSYQTNIELGRWFAFSGRGVLQRQRCELLFPTVCSELLFEGFFSWQSRYTNSLLG